MARPERSHVRSMSLSTTSRRALPGVLKLSGYASSMLLLGIASLVIVPEMIKVEGAQAWGSIALGQAWGAVGAVVIAYGWQISGPALVAQGDPISRRREFEESLALKTALFVPICAVASGAAMMFSTQRPDLAVAGAVSMASIGLTASWFFVGMSRPYHLLAFETVPRVLGTLVGIVVMRSGGGALAGVLCQAAGMLLAAALSSTVILLSLPTQVPHPKRAPLRHTLARQVNGLGASVASSVYISAPVVLIALVAPAIQPVYALVDRLQRQIGVALTPVVSLLQGWVPGGGPDHRSARVRVAIGASSAAGLLLAVAVATTSHLLIGYVGGGYFHVSTAIYVLMGAFVGLVMLDGALAQAVLPTVGRLDVVAKATLLSAVVGLPLTVAGALVSVELALVGLLSGLVGRIAIEMTVALRALSAPD